MIATLERRVRGAVSELPAAYWYLWAGTLIDRLGSFVAPFLAIYLTRHRGVAVEEAALVVALLGAGGVPGSFVGGLLADRIGRRRTLILGLVLGALGMLALGAARDPRVLAAVACLAGFCGNVYRPAVSAAIADLVPPERRVRAFSLLHWAVNLGFSISPVIAGLFADVSYTALFLADAATTLAYAAVVYLRVPEPHRASERPSSEGPRGLGGPLRDLPFVAFALLTLSGALVYAQSTFALPVDMQAHGFGPRAFGLTIALNGVLIVLFQIPISRFVAERSASRVLLLSSLFLAAGFGLYALVSGAPLYALATAVWTGGEILSSAVAPALVARLAPANERGAYQGVFHMTWGLAALGAPLVGGAVLAHASSTALWGACAVVGVLGALGYGILERSLSVPRGDAIALEVESVSAAG